MFSLKTVVNVPAVRNNQKNVEKNIICCMQTESHCEKEQDPEPDPDPY